MHMEVVCENCETTLLLPVNTLTGLCPCCFTVTHIPLEMLPNIEEPVVLEGEDEVKTAGKSVYVQHLTSMPQTSQASTPAASPSGHAPAHRGKVSVATELRLDRLVKEQEEAEAADRGEAVPEVTAKEEEAKKAAEKRRTGAPAPARQRGLQR